MEILEILSKPAVNSRNQLWDLIEFLVAFGNTILFLGFPTPVDSSSASLFTRRDKLIVDKLMWV